MGDGRVYVTVTGGVWIHPLSSEPQSWKFIKFLVWEGWGRSGVETLNQRRDPQPNPPPSGVPSGKGEMEG